MTILLNLIMHQLGTPVFWNSVMTLTGVSRIGFNWIFYCHVFSQFFFFLCLLVWNLIGVVIFISLFLK